LTDSEAGLVIRAGYEPGDVSSVMQHTEIAAQQVFRRPGWPALPTVIIRPDVQLLAVLL
jgi:hypothetical protein